MGNRTFLLEGRLINPEGKPFSNVFVSIVDKDIFSDDLLGAGLISPEGKFKLEFTEEEFNQDFLECEKIPDIYLIFSVYNPNQNEFMPFWKKVLPKNAFKNNRKYSFEAIPQNWNEDLDKIRRIKSEPFPQIKKKRARLNINPDLIQLCFEQVKPIVESATGWKACDNHLKFKLLKYSSDFNAFILDYAAEIESYIQENIVQQLSVIPVLKPLIILLIRNYFFCIYLHKTKTIYLVDNKLKYQPLSFLKSVIGHEYVHAIQFDNNPGLHEKIFDELKLLMSELEQADLLDMDDLTELNDRFKNSSLNRYMQLIEGHASYIQKEFIEKQFNCSFQAGFHQSLIIKLLTLFLNNKNNVSLNSYADMFKIKHDQYAEGYSIFQNTNKNFGDLIGEIK